VEFLLDDSVRNICPEKQGWGGAASDHFLPGVYMRKSLTLLGALFLSATVAKAGPKPQSGSILSHTSVTCGAKKSKKQDIDLLCQQYVVRSGTTDYTIRQPKPSDQTIIPINTSIEFKLDKNKIKFKVDGKSFEFIVVSQAAASSPAAAPASSAPNHQ
jgi:hypothetical protein